VQKLFFCCILRFVFGLGCGFWFVWLLLKQTAFFMLVVVEWTVLGITIQQVCLFCCLFSFWL